MYESHVFELGNEEINVKKIVVVNDATFQCNCDKKAWKNLGLLESNYWSNKQL